MAKEVEEDKKLTSEERITNIITSKDGHREFSTDFVRQEYEDSENDIDYTITNAEHTEMSDGTIISATQLSQPESRGGTTLQRCDGCVDEAKNFINWLLHRNQTRITFSPTKKMKRCYSCRRNYCEKHYVICKDRHVRCRACNHKFIWNSRIHKALRFIFLKKANNG